jgi:hypothetical protein
MRRGGGEAEDCVGCVLPRRKREGGGEGEVEMLANAALTPAPCPRRLRLLSHVHTRGTQAGRRQRHGVVAAAHPAASAATTSCSASGCIHGGAWLERLASVRFGVCAAHRCGHGGGAEGRDRWRHLVSVGRRRGRACPCCRRQTRAGGPHWRLVIVPHRRQDRVIGWRPWRDDDSYRSAAALTRRLRESQLSGGMGRRKGRGETCARAPPHLCAGRRDRHGDARKRCWGRSPRLWCAYGCRWRFVGWSAHADLQHPRDGHSTRYYVDLRTHARRHRHAGVAGSRAAPTSRMRVIVPRPWQPTLTSASGRRQHILAWYDACR